MRFPCPTHGDRTLAHVKAGPSSPKLQFWCSGCQLWLDAVDDDRPAVPAPKSEQIEEDGKFD